MRLTIPALLCLAAGCSHSGSSVHPVSHNWPEGAYEVTSGSSRFSMYLSDDSMAIGGTDANAAWHNLNVRGWTFAGEVPTRYGTMKVWLDQPGHVTVIIQGVRRGCDAVLLTSGG